MSEKGYKEILSELEEGRLANPLFFYGEEEFLITWAINNIIDKFMGPSLASLNVARANWADANISDLVPLWETLPMMAEKRLIIIDNFSFSDKDDGQSIEKEKELMKEIQNIPSYSLLVLTGDSVDKRRKLYKDISSNGGCFEFGRLSEKDLRGFIVKRFKAANKIADNSLIRIMMEESGYFDKQSNYTLFNLENDIKKLIALSDGDRIGIEALKDGLTRNTEAYVFDMIDALSNNNKGEAISLLHRLLSSGEVWQRLLPLICSGYELMLIIEEMRDEGYPLNEIVKKTGAHEYRVKKLSGLSKTYSVKQLRKVLTRCFAVDKEIKTGLLEDVYAMELLLANI